MPDPVNAVPATRGNVGALTTEPLREWYVRENPTDPLFGPVSYYEAVYKARRLSLDEEKSGLAEICTYVSSDYRAGDPVKSTPVLFVAYMYIRGKRSLAGRAAQYHSDRGLPPIT